MTVYQVKDGRWVCGWRDKEDGSKLKKKYFGRGIEAERQAREFDKSMGLRGYGKTGDPQPQSPLFSELVKSYTESRVGIIQKVMTLPESLAAISRSSSILLLPTMGS